MLNTLSFVSRSEFFVVYETVNKIISSFLTLSAYAAKFSYCVILFPNNSRYLHSVLNSNRSSKTKLDMCYVGC